MQRGSRTRLLDQGGGTVGKRKFRPHLFTPSPAVVAPEPASQICGLLKAQAPLAPLSPFAPFAHFGRGAQRLALLLAELPAGQGRWAFPA